jgi:hypothetical protein
MKLARFEMKQKMKPPVMDQATELENKGAQD